MRDERRFATYTRFTGEFIDRKYTNLVAYRHYLRPEISESSFVFVLLYTLER